MKTIKELEAELQSCDECDVVDTELSKLVYETSLKTLKDVLGLIDIRLKQNDRAFRANSIGIQQYNWTKNEFEELKKRITG